MKLEGSIRLSPEVDNRIELPPSNQSVPELCADSRKLLRCSCFENAPQRVYFFSDPTSESFCVFAGYYDHPRLGRPETNLAKDIFEAFSSHGIEDAVSKNGIYAIVLYDAVSRKLFCAVEKYGMFPFYYSLKQSEFLFSNYFSYLVETTKGSLDFSALEEFLVLGYTLADRTPYQEIRKLEPGALLCVASDMQVHKTRYWSFDKLDYQGSCDRDTFLSENRDLFSDIIRKEQASISQAVCLTSSGYDSRRILLELISQEVQPITYTYELLHHAFATPISIETAVVRELLGGKTDRHTTCSRYSPEQLKSYLATRDKESAGLLEEHEWLYPLLELIPENIGINFDGIAGDTLMNNPFYQWPDRLSSLYEDTEKLAHELARNAYDSLVHYDFESKTGSRLADRIKDALDQLPNNPNRLSLFGLIARTRQIVSLLSSNILCSKVESFMPYFDDEFVAHTLLRDPFWRARERMQKQALDFSYPQAAWIPSSHDQPDKIPPEFQNRACDIDQAKEVVPEKYLTTCQQAKLQDASALSTSSNIRDKLLSRKGKTVWKFAQLQFNSSLCKHFFRFDVDTFWAIPRLSKVMSIWENSSQSFSQTSDM